MMLAEGKKPEDHLKAFDLTYSWNVYDVLKDVVDGKLSVNALDNKLANETLQYPINSLLMRFGSNHDKNVQDGPAVVRYGSAGAKAIAALIFTYPGVPLIYNGDEIGNARRLDLMDKVDIDWSKGQTFRALYTKLVQFRREHAALRRGSYRRLSCSDSSRVYAFERSYENDTVDVVINFSDQRKEIKFETAADLGDVFGQKTIRIDNKQTTLSLPAYGYAVLIPIVSEPHK